LLALLNPLRRTEVLSFIREIYIVWVGGKGSNQYVLNSNKCRVAGILDGFLMQYNCLTCPYLNCSTGRGYIIVIFDGRCPFERYFVYSDKSYINYHNFKAGPICLNI